MRYLRLAISLILALTQLTAAQPVVKQLAPGVFLTQEIDTNPQCPLIINCVSVDLTYPQVEIKAAIGKDVVYANDQAKGRETISSLTSRRGALVGINADFFPFTGDPLGVCIIDGELISEPPGNRAALAITKDRKVFFDTPSLVAILTTADGASRAINGINRTRETNQIVVYTSLFGASTTNRFKSVDLICASSDLSIRVNTPIRLTVNEVRQDAIDTPIPAGGVVVSGGGEAASFLAANVKPGDTITVRFDIKSPNDLDWTNVTQAVGGGPWLLRDGNPWIDTVAEGFSVNAFEKAKHPRTAVGLTADNKLLLVTVDGRQTISAGVTLPELAMIMKRLGAMTAINLDGGGSTTLSVKGIVVNAPSEGVEREVASAILVFAPQQPCDEAAPLAITGVPAEVVSGFGMMLQLTCGDAATLLAEDKLKSIVWGTTRGVGFVNQRGYFTPVKARKGTVNAIYCSQAVSAEVSVLPGSPTKLLAKLEPDKTNPLRSTFKVTALDLNGNPVPAKEVLLNITGGRSDLEGGVTDAKGTFTTGITWEPGATNRLATAVVGEVSAEVRPK
ncbi:MAG: phosphodiester glycosidase family protein [Armatimonadetes bacterium]|nr:phosphodiester glycosidase family protein [Armatimonadota bacterium]